MEQTWYKFKHPFTMMVAGPTSSGKTWWVASLVKTMSHMIHPVPERVLWCYAEPQPLYAELKEKIGDRIFFQHGLPPKAIKPNTLLVVDDLMRESGVETARIFEKGSHHRNVSVIFIVQNLFHQKKEQRDISLNSHYIVLLKNPRDRLQFESLARQVFPLKARELRKVYDDATKEPHGYLLLDFIQTCPDEFRLRTRVFPGEEHIYYGV